MPLTARCHSLRPERSSGWLAFFELIPRGGRAAHFLVVGPADNLDRAAHEVALRGAQAAVRYLKDVPPQAPTSTILDSVSRLLLHEAGETGAAIEFGCAVLEADRILSRTHGRVRLLRLGEERRAAPPAEAPDAVPAAAGERYFLGRVPPAAEAGAEDFLARLEHGGGGDGGLVLTLAGAPEGSRLGLAPTDPAATPAEPGREEAAPAPPAAEEAAVSGNPSGPPHAGEPGAPEPREPDEEESRAAGTTRHEWKTVDLPPRPEALGAAVRPRKGETLPMWEDVALPGESSPDEAGEAAPPAPGKPESAGEGADEAPPPFAREEEAAPRPEASGEAGAAEPFSDLVSELRDVFAGEADEDAADHDAADRGVEEAEDLEPRFPAAEELPPPDRPARTDEEASGPEAGDGPEAVAARPPGEAAPLVRLGDEDEEDDVRLEAADDGERERAGAGPEPAGGARASRPEAGTELYAREETRGLGFWLGVVAAIVALAALVVYLTVLRPRVAAPPGDEAAAPETPAEESAADDALASAEPAAAWAQNLEAAVTSSPLVAGDLVIFGCRDGRVYALDRATGRREWAYAASDGFGSSPALAGDLVVIGGYDGRLYGLDLATGEERWSHETGGRVVASPAVDETSAYVGSYGRALTAVSLADGSPRWSRDLGSVLWSSPVVADDLVVTAGLDGVVTALDRAGGGVVWQARTGGPVYSSPVVAERKVIVGSQDGSLYAFDLASGETAWAVEAGSAVDGSPGYHEGRVVVGTNEGLVLGVDVGLGRVVWRVATGGEVKSRPAFRGRLAWLTGYDGFLHGIEWLTGAEAARYPIDSSAYSSPAIGDGTAYFGTMDGRFLAVHLGGAAP